MQWKRKPATLKKRNAAPRMYPWIESNARHCPATLATKLDQFDRLERAVAGGGLTTDKRRHGQCGA